MLIATEIIVIIVIVMMINFVFGCVCVACTFLRFRDEASMRGNGSKLFAFVVDVLLYQCPPWLGALFGELSRVLS